MKINKFMMLVGLAVMASLTITSCKVDEPDTNPLNKQGVNLVAFGPNPVARGGYMRFMGTGMDQIASVTLAGQELTIEPVSSEEIKTLIPQDAKIGDVVLKTKAGKEIVGKRQVTYTEPVGFDAEKPFEPATIKAGGTLTINGEYLNLVTKVILSDGVEVTKFKEKDRKHIVIEKFPAEAQTGKVILSFVATGDSIAQEIPSEAKLDVVLPTVNKVMELKEVKAGDVKTITGENLDLVTEVLSTTGDPLKYEVSNGGKSISITMPEVVMDGTINIVVASGIKIPVATIGVALPKVASITPNKDLRPGDVITVAGKDLEIISGVTYLTAAGTATVEPESVAKETVTFKMPDNATSGALVFNTTANINVEDAEKFQIVTLKPAVTAFNPSQIAMGGTIAVEGTDLDLVHSVTLTGGAVLEPADVAATTFNITIPYAEAETGKVTLTMKNGEQVTPEVELTIDAPEGCYATAWPDPELEIKAGTMMVITVANIDKLTGVKIDGQDCQIIKIGDQLYIAVPDAAGKNSVITLVSDNGDEIPYSFAFIPNTEQKRTLWKGIQPLSWGTPPEGQVNIAYDDVFKSAPVGAELVICYTQPVADWPQMQFNNGSWVAQKDLVNPDGSVFTNGDGAVAPKSLYGDVTEPTYRETSLILTEEVLSSLVGAVDEWGNILHLQGADFILNEVFLRWTISLETTLATGNWEAMGWGNQPTILASGALSAAGAKPGQMLRIYVTANDGWGCQITSGWWTMGTAKHDFAGYDLVAHNNAFEIVLDAEDVSLFDTEGIVVNGDGLVVTKVTLE